MPKKASANRYFLPVQFFAWKIVRVCGDDIVVHISCPQEELSFRMERIQGGQAAVPGGWLVKADEGFFYSPAGEFKRQAIKLPSWGFGGKAAKAADIFFSAFVQLRRLLL